MDSSSHVSELRSKWMLYDQRLREGDNDGSLVGASFIIARSGVTDVLALLDRLERAEAVVGAARHLERNAMTLATCRMMLRQCVTAYDGEVGDEDA